MPEAMQLPQSTYDPTQGLGVLNMALGLQQKKIAIQQAAQNLQTGQAFQQQEQQASATGQMVLGERQGMSKMLSSGQAPDGSSIKGDDGTPDVDLVAKWAPVIAPTTYPQYLTTLQQVKSNSIAIKDAGVKLDQDSKTLLANALGTYASPTGATHSYADISSALTPIGAAHADNPYLAQAISGVLGNLKHIDSIPLQGDPSAPQYQKALQTRQNLVSHVLGSLDPKYQAQVGTVDVGSAVQPTMTMPGQGTMTPSSAPMTKGLAPGVITQPITGAPAQIGGAAGTTPRPIGGPGWQPYAGQQEDVKAFQGEVGNIRTNADQAPLAHNINQQILRLADNAKTGPGTEIWQHAVGALGAPLGLSPTANYQELGKFLEKNAITNMQSMGGPPSDARLSAAAAANGSTNFSPEALKAVTKFNDATTTGLQQYRQAVDSNVGMGQGVNYTKLPLVKSAWAKNFDVNVFRVENAIRDGDTQELQKIKQELGPQGLKQLALKRQNLTALTQGQMPQ